MLVAAYNIFDGTENLPLSIASIRSVANKVIGVYQTVSNYGNPIGYDIEAELKMYGFDELIHYTPNIFASGAQNECSKRNIGLERAEQLGADYFITVDCDEVYDGWDFQSCFNYFTQSGADGSACKMQTYYGDLNHRYATPEDYYVPLFYKVIKGRRFKEYTQWPVLADPTRKLAGNVHIFSRNEIQMQHLSYVRKDIRMKLENSSALKNHRAKIDEIESYYKAWKPGMDGLTVHGITPLTYSPISV